MKSAKTASARTLPALAVAAALLAGCGGESSSTSSSTAAPADAASEAGSGAAAGAGGGPGASAPSAEDAIGAAGSAAPGGQTAPGGQASAGGKHGPPVPVPTSAPAPKITPEQRREATVADLSLQSPSSLPSTGGPQALPAEFTCDGKGTSPALRWRGVPEGTAELALFAMNIRPVEGKLFFDWAVGGLSPELEEIEAGKLPKGAVVGRNSFGKTSYEICPEGGEETYMFTLFALPKALSPAQGFEPFAFRKAVLDVSGDVGLLALSYARG